MSEYDIKKYYGTLDMQQLKMVALSRKIYPWRKFPIIRGEDAAYAAQNINARRVIVDNDVDNMIGFSALDSDYLQPLNVKPSLAVLAGRVEGIFSANIWIDPEADLPAAGLYEIDYVWNDTIANYLKRNEYFLTELDERPSGFLQKAGIPSKDLVAWVNKSFEKMTVCLIDNRWKGNYPRSVFVSGKIRYTDIDGVEREDDGAPFEAYYSDNHLGSLHYAYQYVPDLDSIKFFSNEVLLDTLEVDLDNCHKYNCDWIGGVKILMILIADSSYTKLYTAEHTSSRKSFLLVLDGTYITVRDILDTYALVKEKMNFTPNVDGEYKSFKMSIRNTGVIVKINKIGLMITGD